MDTQPTPDQRIAGHKRKLSQSTSQKDQPIGQDHHGDVPAPSITAASAQADQAAQWADAHRRRPSSVVPPPSLNYCSADLKDHAHSSEAKRPRRGSGSSSIRRVQEHVRQQVAAAISRADALDIHPMDTDTVHVHVHSPASASAATFPYHSPAVSPTTTSPSSIAFPSQTTSPVSPTFPSSQGQTISHVAEAGIIPAPSVSNAPVIKRPRRTRKRAHSMPQIRTKPLYEFVSKSAQKRHTPSQAHPTIPILPPITRATLRELDLSEILKNPQLRHDIIFDPNLQFRPNFDGERGQRKHELAERYWRAVERQVRGCRCGGATIGRGNTCQCPLPRMRPDYTRIPHLIAELQAILLSLLPTTIPGDPDHHALIAGTLDPELIAQELKHQVLNVGSLVQFIGETLKMHCAPMRDEVVDRMVQTVCHEGNVVKGLRMCFEILEYMKLDIANHQLRTLRPYLLDTAVEFEQKYFADQLERKVISFHRTISWLVRSWNKVHMNPAISNKGLQAAFSDGLLGLVTRGQSLCSLPESFHLDQYRLLTFHNDFTDLVTLALLLLLYRQLAGAKVTNDETIEIKREIWALLDDETSRRSGPATSIPGRHSPSASRSTWSISMQNVVMQIVRRAKTRGRASTYIPTSADMSLVTSWMDRHLNPDSGLFKLVQSRLVTHLESMLHSTGVQVIDKYTTGYGMPCSVIAAGGAAQPVLSSVRDAATAPTPCAPSSPSSSLDMAKLDAHGLLPLAGEIKVLGERIRKLGNFHFSVFGGWYKTWIVEYLARNP